MTVKHRKGLLSDLATVYCYYLLATSMVILSSILLAEITNFIVFNFFD